MVSHQAEAGRQGFSRTEAPGGLRCGATIAPQIPPVECPERKRLAPPISAPPGGGNRISRATPPDSAIERNQPDEILRDFIAYRFEGQPPHRPRFLGEGITDLCGLAADELTSGRVEWEHLVHPDDAQTYTRFFVCHRSREPYEREYRLRHTNGSWRWVWERGHGIFDASGNLLALAGLIVDATARKAAEARARESDRQLLETRTRESLGVLAGGVAHHFNNLLTIILRHASLARFELPPDSPLHRHLEQIEHASRRAAELSAKLLAYTGRSSLAMRSVDLSAVVRDTVTLFAPSTDKIAQLRLRLAPSLPPLVGDASLLRQVIVNLMINASEAIGGKAGEIELSTFVREATAEELRQAVQPPTLSGGTYVGLEVRDNGSGIPPDLLPRIFDPFFSTKFADRGLGLSVVLGIVGSHQGALFVDSQPGEGTCVRVLFPAVPTANTAKPIAVSTAISPPPPDPLKPSPAPASTPHN